MTALTGPAELAPVKLALSIPEDDDTDDERLTQVIDAVNDVVRGLPIAQPLPDLGADPPGAWSGRVVEGATLLAARLFRRRNSPAGVEAMGTDGAVYVMRSDPDIAMLLQLGPWRPPVIG